MEAEILEESIEFSQLMLDILEIDEAHRLDATGSLRDGGRLDIRVLGDSVWLKQFRFTQAEVKRLADVLDLPPYIRDEGSRNHEDKVVALCMLLRKLAYPIRHSDVELLFGWEKSRFSRITRATALFLWNRWKHLLRFDPTRLTPARLAYFARKIQEKGAPLDLVAAVIDGTLQKNTRPVANHKGVPGRKSRTKG
ncbi:hypothetical protein NMY22_g6792 [Coprinellus aureogranulatus]|nr:hypothetical protein NMY22_g6792 [Coprinellus aureogranulatus]